MQHEFQSTVPQQLYVEIGGGRVNVVAEETDRVLVEVSGESPEDVVVEQRGDLVVVVAPRRTGFFSGSPNHQVRLVVPRGADLTTKTGSADVTAVGTLGHLDLTSGSGEVEVEAADGDAVVKTGSGDVGLGQVGGRARIKSGSGDVEIRSLQGKADIGTGSGDIAVGRTTSALQLKSGSGDLRVGEAASDLTLTTASGDLRVSRFSRGQVSAKNVSGDIRLGIPAGVPVWTDVSSTSGHVRSSLVGAGRPADGQDHIEIRARTVSGDILLDQLDEGATA